MKGLVRNNIYSMLGNIKLGFILSLFLALSPIFIGESSFSLLYIIIPDDDASCYRQGELKAVPAGGFIGVERGVIIGAKFLSLGLLVLCGLAASLLTVLFAFLVKLPLPADQLFLGYTFGLSLSIMTMAFMLPMLLKAGTEKNELMFILSTIGSICVMLLTALCLAGFTGGMNWRHPLVTGFYVVLALLLFAASFLVCKKIYQRKEF